MRVDKNGLRVSSKTREQEDVVDGVLYYFPFSIYSLMIRFALELGLKLDSETAPHLDIQLTNLHEDEHLSEEYLALNPKGQVPCLWLASLEAPLIDSRDISEWLCARQPELMPLEHRDQIQEMLDMLYDFHARALDKALDDPKDAIPNRATAMLESSKITESHRRRLEIKSMFHETTYSRTLEPANVERAEFVALRFCKQVGALREKWRSHGMYIFGEHPTILDAHATVFLARMMETGREEFVGNLATHEYVLGMMNTEEWLRTTCGRKTAWTPEVGPVSEFEHI